MKKALMLIVIATFVFSCKLMKKEDEKKSTEPQLLSGKSLYGMMGADSVFQFTLKNEIGMTIKILNYGGIVTDVMVTDRDGKVGNVVLAYDSLSGYLQAGNPYFGCLVGRYANRIANAKFSLDGKEYVLAPNNYGNSLHGGIRGFDKVIWNVESYSISKLVLSYQSKDGEEGYPGNLDVEVTYSVMPDNALGIEYRARTDKKTVVNLTNHCYFNLSAGADSTILDHELMLTANKYTPVNDKIIPTGKIESVKGGPMDFTALKKIGKDISQVSGGYDHNWVLNEEGFKIAASLYHQASGRYMVVLTSQPGIQFYSGNFLDGTLQNTRGGAKYIKHAGLCLETQHFPDSPNQPSFPSTVLEPGKVYFQSTYYKFSVR